MACQFHTSAIRLWSRPGKGFPARRSIEEKKRGAAMLLFQVVERVEKSQGERSLRFPAFRARLMRFRVKSMLCSTSFARSPVDADDRLPTPVFDKSGSGLKR
jgi:hypothetical protein